jgi:acyl carrier protein
MLDIGYGSVMASNTIIQRRQLPLLGAYVEPRSPTERMLAEIWRRAFGMDCVGVADSYEDLGGDSLLAASIFVEIETSFGVKVPWTLLLEARTIEQMAQRIDGLQQRAK